MTATGIDGLASADRVLAASRACDRFEADWRAGRRPDLAAVLSSFPAAEQPALLAELLPIDADHRRAVGETPAPADYARLPGADPATVARLVGAAPAAVVPCRLGPFALLEQVGVGATGAVWLAHDERLDREVAVKLPHPGLILSSPETRERFAREARAAARLRHPGIVTVHEVLEVGGVPALVEEYVSGGSLKALLAARRLTPREAAGLAAEAADALAYAHRMGAVHRDVKPANVMIQPPGPGEGGPGRPRLVDFGLAVRDAGEVTLTLDGQVVGTPAYMSPEQAAGRGHAADARTDVYGLGAVLYEMLACRPPFAGTGLQLLDQIARTDPPPLAGVPADLATVCLKCLEKEPGRRYSSADDLADDLRRFLRGEPVLARPVGPVARATRWAARRPTAAALVAVALFAAVATAVLGLELWHSRQLGRTLTRLDHARADAELARAAERAERDRAEAALYFNRMALAAREWEAGKAGGVEQLLAECPEPLRGWEWRYLRGRCREEALTLRPPSVTPGYWSVGWVGWTPAGDLTAALHDGGVHVWDGATGAAKQAFGPHPAAAYCFGAALSPDGRRVATAGRGVDVAVWDVRTGQLTTALIGPPGQTFGVAYSPDGRRVAAARGRWTAPVGPDHRNPHEVRVWDARSGEVVRVWDAGGSDVIAVAYHPDGRRVAAACGAWVAGAGTPAPGRLAVLDVDTGEARDLVGHDGPVVAVAYSPDGRTLASGGWDGTVRLWDVDAGAERCVLRGHRDWVRGVGFSPDGARLASGGADGLVVVWDVATGAEVRTFRGHTHQVMAVAFAPDGERLASAGADQTVRVWALDRPTNPRRLDGPGGALAGVGFGPDGTVFAAANPPGGGAVLRWDDRGGPPRELFATRATLYGLAVSPDGRRAATPLNDGRVLVWDAAGGPPRAVRHPGPARAARFAADCRTLYTLGMWDDQPAPGGPVARRPELAAWDAATGERRAVYRDRHGDSPRALAAHPDGRQFAVGDNRGYVQVLTLDPPAEVAAWPAHDRAVTAVAYSPDGRHLATASADATVRVWAADAGRPVATGRGHARSVGGLAFSPDGRRLASGGDDGAVKVWEPLTGWEVLTLTAGRGPVAAVAYSPDGRRLAATGQGGAVFVWEAPP